MFTSSQIKQLSDRGISLAKVMEQVELFKKGIAPVKLARPAIPRDGIEVFEQKKIDYYVNLFKKEKTKISIIKFVPASGAASRMFKSLFEALSVFSKNPTGSTSILKKMPEIEKFIKDLNNYPFYDDLLAVCSQQGISVKSLIKSEKYAEILNLILSSEGLSYGELPKGLLRFHKYKNEARTAFEEHFFEAALYLKDNEGKIKIHFTVSPEHRKLFELLSGSLIDKYLELQNIQFNVEFSEQKPSTDTLAVDMENSPFNQEHGMLLFRPGGHGALLDNMQDLNEKMVFVGNIDNVAPDRLKAIRIRYKELLAGILIERVQVIHSFLISLENDITLQLKNGILDFVRNFVSASSADELIKLDDSEFIKYAKLVLDRPIRVCGMVKNVGEPGGGPFWISDKSGILSKQVVESSQVNLSDPEQDRVFRNATHFNPVDMVCYIYGYTGKKFILENFRDSDMAFIAVKSQGGNTLKALELPGLWNGSMAGWLTFFVDVPIETFSPVKTIFDLHRDEHIA
jgi:hypothetical protein